jgi:hypothetical protein
MAMLSTALSWPSTKLTVPEVATKSPATVSPWTMRQPTLELPAVLPVRVTVKLRVPVSPEPSAPSAARAAMDITSSSLTRVALALWW